MTPRPALQRLGRQLVHAWRARRRRVIWVVIDEGAEALRETACRLAEGHGRLETTLPLPDLSALTDTGASDTGAPAEAAPIGTPGPDLIVLATVESDGAELTRKIVALRGSGAALVLVGPILERLGIGRRLAGEPASRTLSIPRADHGYPTWQKRTLDLAVTPLLLAVSLPFMSLLAVAVRLTSRGPALFRQTRLGQAERPFTFLKFRTMVSGNDDGVHREYLARFIAGQARPEPSADPAQPIFKLTNDRRITPLGRVMRRLSLDELPQLFNVLGGSMSLVGPRPPLAYEAAQYQPWHRLRFQTEAGITGFWQVYGRSRVSFDDAVLLDILYAMCRSPWLDLKLIALTIPAALSGRGGV